jgi:hypothetical protein
MRELRFKADGGVWRVAFAFDPERNAILLVAGDKSGASEKKFYKRLIEKARKGSVPEKAPIWMRFISFGRGSAALSVPPLLPINLMKEPGDVAAVELNSNSHCPETGNSGDSRREFRFIQDCLLQP